MRAVTVVFDYPGHDKYQRLAKVFQASWEKNSQVPLEVISIPAPPTGYRHISFYSNTEKLRVWRELFTQDTIFVDADMLCLRCPSVGFDMVDNIGLTDRSGPFPINGGVMFVKYTKTGQAFMRDFEEINYQMLADPDFHKPWLDKYAGINQSAIGYLIENKYPDYNLLPEKFNLCDGWKDWREAYLVHIKGQLRQLCLKRRRRVRYKVPYSDIVQEWTSYED